ncbi:MAG: GAP family protein [Actinobacteria bacterium]|jgi:hypothetical protein|nr:MAG: GAP family protein [Actinomycetota bacterium]
MGGAIGDILPLAIGVAISPVPIIAVILMLFSGKARSNSLAFLFGWILGIAAVGVIALLLGNTADIGTSSGPARGAAAIRLALGLLLLFGAFRQWRKRPGEGEEPQMPKWMAGIDAFNAVKSCGLAALLSGVNPKNLALVLAAAMTISQAGLNGAQPWIVLLVFVVIASLSVAIPVLTYVLAGEKAESTLTSWKTWLTANNAVVMAVLFLVFGFLLIGKGIGGLS